MQLYDSFDSKGCLIHHMTVGSHNAPDAAAQRSVQTINRVYGSMYGSVCDTVWLFLTMVGQPSNSQMQLDSMGTAKCSVSLV